MQQLKIKLFLIFLVTPFISFAGILTPHTNTLSGQYCFYTSQTLEVLELKPQGVFLGQSIERVSRLTNETHGTYKTTGKGVYILNINGKEIIWNILSNSIFNTTIKIIENNQSETLKLTRNCANKQILDNIHYASPKIQYKVGSSIWAKTKKARNTKAFTDVITVEVYTTSLELAEYSIHKICNQLNLDGVKINEILVKDLEEKDMTGNKVLDPQQDMEDFRVYLGECNAHTNIDFIKTLMDSGNAKPLPTLQSTTPFQFLLDIDTFQI